MKTGRGGKVVSGETTTKKYTRPEIEYSKSVLVVSSLYFPFIDWIDDKTVSVVLLTTESVKNEIPKSEQKSFRLIESFDHYATNCMVEATAIQLHKTYNFNYIVCLSEEEMLRCARLRELLKLPGQSVQSTMLFRDKVLMKTACVKAGLACPAFAALETPVDLIRFIAQHGYPVVVKPRKGYGSVNTTVIKDEPKLVSYLEKDFCSQVDGPLEMMVEAFVTGQMYHIDGFFYDGECRLVWPSRYTNTVVNFNENAYIAAYSLQQSSPLLKRLQEFCRQSCVVLAEHGPKTFPFHCEVWHTPNDELIFCENASRAGGGGITSEILSLFGVTLRKLHLQAQIEQSLTLESKDVMWDVRLPLMSESVAWIYIYPHVGTLTLPTFVEQNYILFYEPYAQNGTVYTSRKSCGDAVCNMIVTGNTEKEVEENIVKAYKWWNENVKWSRADSEVL